MVKELATALQIQQRLTELGIFQGKTDGIMGPKTRAAIRGFQRIHKLDDDGIVGPKTYMVLFQHIIADRLDLGSPKAAPNSPWPHQTGCMEFYGPVGSNQVRIEVPYPLVIAWDKRKTVRRVSVHTKVATSSIQVLTRVLDHYGLEAIKKLRLDIWGGTLNVRKMRGGTSWSMHSWGIAWDFDPENNQLRWGRDKALFAKPEYEKWWEFWEEEGWVSLGKARNYDWMHVQAARI
jgi:hypothetical protein